MPSGYNPIDSVISFANAFGVRLGQGLNYAASTALNATSITRSLGSLLTYINTNSITNPFGASLSNIVDARAVAASPAGWAFAGYGTNQTDAWLRNNGISPSNVLRLRICADPNCLGSLDKPLGHWWREVVYQITSMI